MQFMKLHTFLFSRSKFQDSNKFLADFTMGRGHSCSGEFRTLPTPAIKYFRKTLLLRCLTGFWMRQFLLPTSNAEMRLKKSMWIRVNGKEKRNKVCYLQHLSLLINYLRNQRLWVLFADCHTSGIGKYTFFFLNVLTLTCCSYAF